MFGEEPDIEGKVMSPADLIGKFKNLSFFTWLVYPVVLYSISDFAVDKI